MSLLIIIASVIIFILLREFFCWYFKINKMVKHQKMQIESQYKILEKLGGEVNWDELNIKLHGQKLELIKFVNKTKNTNV